ncbi:S8 family serine peptidase [Rheinheimera sp. WS51]|uniref:S8 family serine peptidase n=1 Tax=Rheinheimera sp. WS51 TaxID=3425886 RepID=UPI003D8BF0E8
MQSKSRALPKMTVLAAFVASTISYGTLANTLTASPMNAGPVQTQLDTNYKKVARTAAERQYPTYYIVQLEDAPVSTYSGGVRGYAPTSKEFTNKDYLDTQSVEAVAYGEYLKARQAEVASALQSKFPSLNVQRSVSLTLNGLIVSFPGDVDVKAQLQSVPGVKKVYENETFYAHMDASLDLINAPAVWDQIGDRDRAGEGVKVAVIDGGIRAKHPMFASNGHTRPEGLPTDDYCSVTDPDFCNDKLVLARYYAPTSAVHPDETMTPLDLGGHGTHVAGTAVGNAVSTNYVGVDVNFSGVAPGATLMVYKALFVNPEGRGTGSGINLLSALEDAVADGADVINNSWGGGAGGHPENSWYKDVFTNAEAAGVVLVTAAGNDGPGAQTIGCPGCIEAGITVASTQTGRSFGHLVSGPGADNIPARLGTGDFTITEDITATLMPAINVDEENGLGCAPFPEESLTDQIVLLSRGECSFTQKAENAQAAGAVGMILANNAPGVILMSMPGATLPSVSILQADGEAMLAAWQEGDEATITKSLKLTNTAAVNAMSDFSSRGPNGDNSFLKPDIAAPGSDILSAYTPSNGEEQYGVISGTSMASPHVAGAAALLRQLRPELNAFQIKSILMTSSNPAVKMEDLVEAATPFDRGAGLLDVEAANNTAISFDKPSIVSTSCIATCSFERTVTNLMPEDGEWTATLEFASDKLTGEVSTPTIMLSAKGETEEEASTATFTVTVDSRYADIGWQFGQVVFTDASGQYPAAHLPIAVMAKQSDDSSIITTTLTAGEVTAGNNVSMNARAGYSGTDEAVTLTVNIPEGTNLVDESVVTDKVMAEEIDLTISEDKRVITWTGTISNDPGVQSIESAPEFPFAGQKLSDIVADSPTLPCESSRCDETPFDFPIGNYGGFIWNGQLVEAMTISPNGFITAAPQDYTLSYINERLPNADDINAMIAPLWADLIIGAEYGGQANYNLLTEDEDTTWFVMEWEDVTEAQFDDDYNPIVDPTADRFTFSIWIKLGTEEVYFNYIDMPAMPTWATVGIEDITGTKGTSYYYDGEGTAPVSGQALRANMVEGAKGSVVVNYDLAEVSFGTANDVSVETFEQDPVAIDLSTEFTTGTKRLLSEVSLTTSEDTLRAIKPFDILPAEDAVITIATNPANGTLTPITTTSDEDEETVVGFSYTANADFGGVDTFTYYVANAEGVKTNEATVSIDVSVTPPKSSKKWYEGSFGAVMALFALPLVWLRRRRTAAK